MIRVLGEGEYKLAETPAQIKILVLGSRSYLWLFKPSLGQTLVAASRKKPKVDRILAIGRYRLYEVKDESDLSNLKHLELSLGHRRWQGYLLHDNSLIIKTTIPISPTAELISCPINSD